MKGDMKTPDILNSKIKRLQIELPHYSFSHSSSSDSSHDFLGRKRISEKLQKLIEDDIDKTGVYLVAGNRGAGKTRLVNHVAGLTSLQPKSDFTENLKFLFLQFLAVVGVQFCLKVFNIHRNHPIILEIVSFWIFVLSFVLLCCFNGYNRKCSKRTSWRTFIKNGAKYALEELKRLINPDYPYGKAQCLLKIIVVVGFTQVVSTITCFTPSVVSVMVSVMVLGCMFFQYRKRKLREYEQKHKDEKLSKRNYIYLALFGIT